ncbi:MAG: 2OG-Fe(II) oxygenase [Myxococcota bacterium]
MWTDDDMMRLADGDLLLQEHVLPQEVVRTARSDLSARFAAGDAYQAGTGKHGQHRRVRGDHILWLEPPLDGALGQIWTLFAQLQVALRDGLRMPLASFELQAARYDTGASYAKHHDAFHASNARLVTAILYLNEGWSADDGGHLVAWPRGERREVAPLGGRLVVFRSESVLHEVQTARAERWAVTAWYRGASATHFET